MYSVSVRSDSQQGIGELKGVLRFEDDRLRLQYQLADPILAEFRMQPVTLELALDNIAQATYRAGFLGLVPSVELRLTDFHPIAMLPTAEPGRLQLRVSRGDRGDARRIVEAVNAIRSEIRLARLNASIDRMVERKPGSAPDGE
jgi:hypothetical protein